MNHIDERNFPTMVDVTAKGVVPRVARAQTSVQLPDEFKKYFKGEELYLKKGPVFQTAIIAGTMAAKKTHEIIPFCHQVPVESCKFKIETDDDLLVTIICEVRTTSKTGVEMEALHGATVAALAIYDMCKALSHNIVIGETKLLSKVGGKRTVLSRPLYGLILTGGQSQRMQEDKALLSYKGRPHAIYIHDILKDYCENVYLSARKDQWKNTPLSEFSVIEDGVENQGPIAGILAAFETHPEANWFIVACDLVHFNKDTVSQILDQIDEASVATCFANKEEGFPEALCALYTPAAYPVFKKAFQESIRCPVKVLKNSDCKIIHQKGVVNLANINTREELKGVQTEVQNESR